MRLCCLSVGHHTGTRIMMVLKTSATWAKGKLPPESDHCPVYLTGSLSACLCVCVCVHMRHIHTLCQWVSALFAGTGKDEPNKYMLQEAHTLLLFLPKLDWLCPTPLWCSCFDSSLSMHSTLSVSPCQSNPFLPPSLLPLGCESPSQAPCPTTLSPLLVSSSLQSFFFTSIPLLHSLHAPDGFSAFSLLAQTVPALPQSSPPKKSLSQPGSVWRL